MERLFTQHFFTLGYCQDKSTLLGVAALHTNHPGFQPARNRLLYVVPYGSAAQAKRVTTARALRPLGALTGFAVTAWWLSSTIWT